MDITAGDVFKAITGSILSAVIAGVVALVVSARNTSAQRRVTLDAMQNKAIELAMQYPHIESDEYCDKWPTPAGDPGTQQYKDDKERYDNYCCYIFNMIRQTWEFAGKNLKNIDDELVIKEYIIRHRCWWIREDSNVHFYTQEFRSLVNGVIDEEKRAGGCK